MQDEPAPMLGVAAHLLSPGWTTAISLWLQEDCPSFDYGGFVVGETIEEAVLYGKTEVRIYNGWVSEQIIEIMKGRTCWCTVLR